MQVKISHEKSYHHLHENSHPYLRVQLHQKERGQKPRTQQGRAKPWNPFSLNH